MKKEDKLKKFLAIIALLIISALFLSIVIIGLFFTQHTHIMIGLIIALTVFCALIYFLIMFIKLKNQDN